MVPAMVLCRSGLTQAARSMKGRLPRPRSRQAPQLRQLRFQSTTSSSPTGPARTPQASRYFFVAGLAGGLAAGSVLYGAYLLTPSGKMARAINKATVDASIKYNQAAQKFQQTKPDPDYAISYMRNFCYSYVSSMPGGRKFVDAAFDDIEKVRNSRKDDADRLLNDALDQFQDLSRSGLSVETLRKAWDLLANLSSKLAELSSDAFADVMDNHPQLKDKLGGSIDQLKQMGDQYGPEAKKQVGETLKQVKEAMASGLSASNLDEARKLIQDKIKQVRKLGDEAWQKGMEQAKPYLEKTPQVQELVEKNADALKQGNAKELFDKIKKACESGKTEDVEMYIKKTVQKFGSKGSQLGGNMGPEQFFDKIPNGSDILPKLQQLREVAEEQTEEGERLVKETTDELKKVLEKSSEKAREILKQAKKDAE